MFSAVQKRQISEKVQMILRMTNHPELPREEIHFSLHVDGAASWSWADIQNNSAVPISSVNPWNEVQAEPQHEPEPKPDKVKPLAQYLDEYIQHEYDKDNIGEDVGVLYAWDSWRELFEQAFDAYESTENVKIRIERVIR